MALPLPSPARPNDPKIRVLIVDDSVVVRKLIGDVLKKDPQIEVVGIAANGRIALEKIPQLNPDIITLDVEMPELDGLATLREIRKSRPKLPVIMLSSLTLGGASVTLDALAAGANDFVTKPSNVGSVGEALAALGQDLIPKIRLHCRRFVRAPALADGGSIEARPAPPAPPRPAVSRFKTSPIEIVCIGTSTGGPNALSDVFATIRQSFPVPIVIVQHMPPLFTRLLAERLNRLQGPLQFHEGEEGMILEVGHVYIAPGGKHMEIRRDAARVSVHLQEGPLENSCRPAVDVLFRSVVACYRSSILGVIMTGMGQDGLRGCEGISGVGGRILAQDEASSVVWGMPGFVAKAGLADEVLPLSQIGPKMSELVLLYGTRSRAPLKS